MANGQFQAFINAMIAKNSTFTFVTGDICGQQGLVEDGPPIEATQAQVDDYVAKQPDCLDYIMETAIMIGCFQ